MRVKLSQFKQARISVAIEAVAADLRHIYVLTNTGDIMTFDFGDSRYFVLTIFQTCQYFFISDELRKNLTIRNSLGAEWLAESEPSLNLNHL